MHASEWTPDDDPSASSIQSTLWSVILRTADPKDPHRIAGLVRLTSTYSMALYVYGRRKGLIPSEAKKAVCAFFDYVRAGQLGKGHDAHRDRLRSFLLSAYHEFLGVREPGAEKGTKGPGDYPKRSVFLAAEAWLNEFVEAQTPPEKIYHRAWARCILAQTYAQLKDELTSHHGRRVAEVITAEVSPLERREFNPELAPKLSLTPSQVLEILGTSRRRLRELILATLRETVSSQSDVEVEFWDLFRSL